MDNPAPRSSAGFAAAVVKLSGPDAVAGGYLALRLTDRLVDMVIPETIRVFRFDAVCLRWVLVARSSVLAPRGFAWAVVHRPGVYTAIGLPREPLVLRKTVQLYAMRSLLHAVDWAERQELLAGTRGVSVADRILDRFRGDPDLSPSLGDPVGNRGPALADIELGEHGLPEFDLLDDISPPYRQVPAKLPPIDLGPLWPKPQVILRPDWISAGPNNVSGRIKSLAVHPSDQNTVYAGAADGGVWKTTDGGDTWHALMQAELSLAIGGIAIAPSDPNVLYAATGEDADIWGPSYPGVGVYTTSDGGQTWTLATGVGDRCSRVVVHPNRPRTAYVASTYGVYKTTDGATWTQVLPGHATDIVIDPVNGDRLLAGLRDDGIHVTTDGGRTWQRSGLGVFVPTKHFGFLRGVLPTGTAAGWIKLAMGHRGDAGTDFAVAKMGPDSSDIYTTSDGGTTWFRLPGKHQGADYNEWTNMIAVHPNDHNVIVAGGVDLERATDGRAFTTTPGTHSDHQALQFAPSGPSRVFMATDGGVYRSNDAGASWTLTSNRLTATQFYSVGVAQHGTFILGGATQDQGIVATTGSSRWFDTKAGNEGGFFIVDPNDSANVYTTPWDANLRRSRDRGVSWTDIRNGMTTTVSGATTREADVAHLAVRPGNSSELVSVGVIVDSTAGYRSARVFRSADQGDNWTSVATLDADGTRVAFCDTAPNYCYVTTARGRVYRSTDSGKTWSEPYPPGGEPTSQWLTALGVDRHDPDIAYVGCAGYGGARVLRTTDGGSTWSDVSGSGDAHLPALPVNCLVLAKCDSDTVFLANDIGVFRTTDGGLTWHDFGDGHFFYDVPRIIVTELALRRSTNTLYASTMGRGVYRRAL